MTETLGVTVLERPIANPGGNLENGDYSVAQGTNDFMLNGETSFAPEEVGGIVEWAWDLNQDGFFDIEQEVFNEPTVPFDTDESGAFRMKLRVTAGNGVSSVTWFTVNVTDVNPVCDAGGPYVVEEGTPLALNASASSAGHPSDPIVAYSWNFGDDLAPQRGPSLVQPLHIYGDARDEPYQIVLVVEDVDSSTECTASVTVTDVEPQIDGIEILNPQAQREGETIRFRVLAEAGSQADPLTNFAWRFGPAGARAEGPAMRIGEWQYADNGTYNVCVTVSDEDTNLEECQEFEIADLAPLPSFVGPEGGLQGELLTFDATATVEGGAADPLTQLVWDWGDGSSLEVVDPNERVRSHTFVQDGDFTVTLRAIDEDSAAEYQAVVTIVDAEPVAVARAIYPGDERSIPEGVPLILDASESQAGSDTDPLDRFIWDFGDGNERGVRANQPGYQYTWADQGIYEVTLEAVDIDGSSDSDLIIVEVTNVAPELAMVASSVQVAIGEPVRFQVLSGEQPDAGAEGVYGVVTDVAGDLPPPVTIWDMGDGSEVRASAHEYVFNQLGRKLVTLSVEDGDGGETTASIELQVTPAAPTIEAVPEQSVREGQELVFDVNILAPRLNPENFDVVDLTILEAPPGANVEVIDEAPHKRVQLTWTPTFYDAGRHRLWIRANSSAAERTRIIDLVVDEAGVPRIAAVGGTASRGVLTFYDYERTQDGVGVALRSAREVELGLGSGDMHVEADGSRVWVSVPGSNSVAVVSTAGSGEVVRRIPVGAAPQGLAFGADLVWVANHDDDTISAIDPESLKVEFTVELGDATGPTDLVWLSDEIDGVEAERLVVVCDGSGHLLTIDPIAARSGIRPIEASIQIGAMLNRVVVDTVTNAVFVADAKTRRVYSVSAAELGAENPAIQGIGLDFSARDMVAQDGVIWVATGSNLVSIEDGEASSHDLIQARALGRVSSAAIPGGAIAVATANRIENYMAANLERVTEAGGSRIRRVETLVAPR